MAQSRDINAALATFRRHGGVLKTAEALAHGIHPEALYKLREEGHLTQLARGLYRLSTAQEFSNPDLAVVATKAPDAVVCLVYALAFHEITTQVPRAVQVAVPRGKYAGIRLRSPPIQVYAVAPAIFDEGVETHKIDGIPVKVYSVARTLADCFKYRNKIGLSIAIEALQFAKSRKRISNREIIHFARLLRQEKVMAPYLDATS
jgi:predicted transcriptional regulator of viral defense system